MQYVDTHTHLYMEPFDKDRAGMVTAARQAGVGHMIMPNVDSNSIAPLMQAVREFPGVCLPMMGLHPTSVKHAWEAELGMVENMLRSESFVAIGETGIDLYWDKTFYQNQLLSFKKHIEWALEMDLPIVVHSRNSLEEIFQVLEQYRGSGLQGVLHCFPGDVAQAEKAVEMGFMLGIGGVVTYKNSLMAKVAQLIGLEHLLLETDAPYLPPVPHRGKRNESAYIPLVAQKVAALKGASVKTVAETTTANARKLFKLSI